MRQSETPLIVWLFAALLVSLPFVRPPVFRVGGADAAAPDMVLVALWSAAGVLVLLGRLRLRVDAVLVSTIAYIATLAGSAVLGRSISPMTALAKLAAYSLYLLVPWLTTL